VSALTEITGTVTGGSVQVQTTSGALAGVGGAARVQPTAGLFLVTRTGQDTFTAVTAVCTHEACTINGLSGTTYVCPCHGSRYNSGGQVLTGPATVSLQTFETAFSGDTLSTAV
jgi:Rieske Fe-S protein